MKARATPLHQKVALTGAPEERVGRSREGCRMTAWCTAGETFPFERYWWASGVGGVQHVRSKGAPDWSVLSKWAPAGVERLQRTRRRGMVPGCLSVSVLGGAVSVLRLSIAVLLQLMAATGSRSGELLSASQRTEHCGRRQVLKANAGWTAMLRQPTSCISGRTESWLQVVGISSPCVASVRVLRSKSGSCKTSLVRVGSLRRPCGKVKGLSRFW